MLFKSAILYDITTPLIDVELAALPSQMLAYLFQPTQGIRPASAGWVNPINLSTRGEEMEGGEGGLDYPSLVVAVAGNLLVCCKIEEKVIPASALNDVLQEKIARFEGLEGRPVRHKESKRLKEDAIAELLPRALPKSRVIHAYIEKGRRMVVNTSSSKDAETVLNLLRSTIGTLNIMPIIQFGNRPIDSFTGWLRKRSITEDLFLGDSCDLLDPEDKSVATFRHNDLLASEVLSALDSGKVCQKLRIHSKSLKFTIDKELKLSALAYVGEVDDEDIDDETAKFQADFFLTVKAINEVMEKLVPAMGGQHRWLL